VARAGGDCMNSHENGGITGWVTCSRNLRHSPRRAGGAGSAPAPGTVAGPAGHWGGQSRQSAVFRPRSGMKGVRLPESGQGFAKGETLPSSMDPGAWSRGG